MAPLSNQDSRARLALLYLFLSPDGAFRQIVKTREQAVDQKAERAFRDKLRYMDMEAALLYDCLRRQKPIILPPSISVLLEILAGCVVDCNAMIEGSYDRLRNLQDRFERTHEKNDTNTFKDLIDFGDNEVQDSILRAFMTCSDELERHVGAEEDIYIGAMRGKRKGPNYKVWKLNKELTKAFSGTTKQCAGCEKLSTTLALATHRKSVELRMDTIVCLNGDILCGKDVELQISMVESWDRPLERATETQKVRWADQNTITTTVSTKPKTKRRKISHLCKPLERAQKSRVKLHFVAEGDVMYLESKALPTVFSSEDLRCTVALRALSSRPDSVLTEETKLVIAVILGHTLLHLYKTSWLAEWKLEDIVFIRSGDTVPLRPFLVSRHSLKHANTESCEDPLDEEDDDDDDFFQLHPSPEILSMGVMLLELILNQSIHTYTNNEFVGFANADYSAAQECYERRQSSLWQHYRNAIEACLNWEELDDIEECRHKIYQNIVKPLEDMLESGFGDRIDVENIDMEAQKLDVLRYGDRINNRPSDEPRTSVVETDKDALTTTHISHAPIESSIKPDPSSIKLATKLNHFIPILPGLKVTPRIGMMASSLISGRITDISRRNLLEFPERTELSRSGQLKLHSAFSLFDDHLAPMPEIAATKTDLWFDTFRELSELLEEAKEPRIKIAVLDTGIDLHHSDMIAYSDRIKDVRSWVDDDEGVENWACGDLHGHGTHIAGIILDIASEAELYVARVTKDGKEINPDSVGKAINWANSNWKVDIITMSFGFPKRVPSIDIALQKTHCLVFAAAANHGGNYERAHPAKHDRVLCIHSTDGDGNKSKFNPNPISSDENFSIVGEAIESTWPGGTFKRKSGTSFAAPVAVGLAGFTLEWARQHMPYEAEALRQLKTRGGMRAVFHLMATIRDGYSYLTPWKLFEIDDIASTRAQILKALR